MASDNTRYLRSTQFFDIIRQNPLSTCVLSNYCPTYNCTELRFSSLDSPPMLYKHFPSCSIPRSQSIPLGPRVVILCYLYVSYSWIKEYLYYVTNQQMHINKIRFVMYNFSPTCCGRFCCHHDVIQVYKQYTKNSINWIVLIIHLLYILCIIHLLYTIIHFVQLFLYDFYSCTTSWWPQKRLKHVGE